MIVGNGLDEIDAAQFGAGEHPTGDLDAGNRLTSVGVLYHTLDELRRLGGELELRPVECGTIESALHCTGDRNRLDRQVGHFKADPPTEANESGENR